MWGLAVFSHAQSLALVHGLTMRLVSDMHLGKGEDFTLRQLALLLTIYRESPPHTVRGLAAKLNVTKPVITRALDAMGRAELVARRRDLNDKRNVIIQRTVKGALFVERLGDEMIKMASELDDHT